MALPSTIGLLGTVGRLVVLIVEATDSASVVAPKSVVGRMMAVVDALASGSDLTVSELSRSTGIPRPTVHRIVGDLVQRHLLTRTDSGFRLGARLSGHGDDDWDRHRLCNVARPYLDELYERTRQTVQLSALDGHEIVVLDYARDRQHPDLAEARATLPAHSAAAGKVTLAFGPQEWLARVLAAGLTPITQHTIVQPSVLLEQLGRARRDGVAYEYEESFVGAWGVAAPVFGSPMIPLAAVSLSGPSRRLQPSRWAAALRRVAADISYRLKLSDAAADRLRWADRRGPAA